MSTFYASDSVKESSELDAGTSSGQQEPAKNTKADMLRSRNLKAYIKQLRHSKLLCERRLQRLNTSSMMYIDDDVELIHDIHLEAKVKNRKVFYVQKISFNKIQIIVFERYCRSIR